MSVPSELGKRSEDLPPSYADIRASSDPIICNFEQVAPNRMQLVPEGGSLNRYPLYNISVALDCFAPAISIHTIRRGPDLDGDFVGEFEMGGLGMDSMECVTVYDVPRPLRQVLVPVVDRSGKVTPQVWKFSEAPETHIFWVGPMGKRFCYAWNSRLEQSQLLAIFYGRGRDAIHRRRGEGRPTTSIKIYPIVHEGACLDHIIISSLILERRWLMGWKPDQAQLMGSIQPKFQPTRRY